MSISSIVTRGFGSWGSINEVVTRGFSIGAFIMGNELSTVIHVGQGISSVIHETGIVKANYQKFISKIIKKVT